MPADLDAYGQQGWTEFLRDVDRLGLLSTVDGHSARIYAIAYSRHRHAQKAIEADGLVIDGPQNSRRINPAVKIAEAAERCMINVLSLYGLSPSDRSRLRASDSAAALDDFEKFTKEHAV
jgi:P27 family predicted phage terminase small subunit